MPINAGEVLLVIFILLSPRLSLCGLAFAKLYRPLGWLSKLAIRTDTDRKSKGVIRKLLKGKVRGIDFEGASLFSHYP